MTVRSNVAAPALPDTEARYVIIPPRGALIAADAESFAKCILETLQLAREDVERVTGIRDLSN